MLGDFPADNELSVTADGTFKHQEAPAAVLVPLLAPPPVVWCTPQRDVLRGAAVSRPRGGGAAPAARWSSGRRCEDGEAKEQVRNKLWVINLVVAACSLRPLLAFQRSTKAKRSQRFLRRCV